MIQCFCGFLMFGGDYTEMSGENLEAGSAIQRRVTGKKLFTKIKRAFQKHVSDLLTVSVESKKWKKLFILLPCAQLYKFTQHLSISTGRSTKLLER